MSQQIPNKVGFYQERWDDGGWGRVYELCDDGSWDSLSGDAGEFLKWPVFPMVPVVDGVAQTYLIDSAETV